MAKIKIRKSVKFYSQSFVFLILKINLTPKIPLHILRKTYAPDSYRDCEFCG